MQSDEQLKYIIGKKSRRAIDECGERFERKENGDKQGRKIEMKKAISVGSLFLSIIAFSFQLSNGQENTALLLHAKESQNGLEIFNYKKVNIRIMGLDEGAKRLGLTREQIETGCELHLRQAGLYPAIRISPYLRISVSVVGSCFHLSIQFMRNIYFTANDNWYQILGTTWSYEMNGEHRGVRESILGAIGECLDTFLKEYLKANLK
jgi:hypothetical protein